MRTGVLGIDISKKSFDAALILDDKIKVKHFANDSVGFVALHTWLKRQKLSEFHACMEATGNYGEELAKSLHNADLKVSVVNPAQIKGFAQCELARTKTDKADAQLIARFCRAMKPKLWQPKPQHIGDLQQWVRRVEALQGMRQQEENRRGSCFSKEIGEAIDEHIASLTTQIKSAKGAIKRLITTNEELLKKQQLLVSIPGVSDATIARVLAFIGEPGDFNSAKEVSAFMGLNPRQYQSGTSVKGRTRISKTGDSQLRKSVYMPALVAMKHNPTIREFCENLSKRGKPKMVIVVAAMRKLVHIIYGVLKTEKPYDPNWNPKLPVLELRA